MIKSSEHKSFYYPAFLTFIFLFLSVGIIITGFLYFENNRKQIKQNKQEEISAIADMKVSQIDNWLKERLGDANLITDNTIFAASVYQLHNGTTDPAIKQDINNFINSFYEHYGYKGILLLDTQGNVQLSVPDFNEPIGPDDKKYISEAVRTKKVVFSDLHRENQEEGILMDLLAPLLIRRGPERIPVGVVLLRIDPHRFLYPAIQTWPTPSRSAEILLVRREGNEVVFLNELRHQKDTALKLRFPISKQHLPAIMAIQGQRGVVEELDYRGVPVLAAIKAVPNSTWLLIAKVDTDEIYAGIRNQAGYVLILVSILIITTGIGIGFLWRQQQARFYYTQYTAERERRALTKHYEYLTKYANDIIIMHDEDGKILEVNDRALSAYGYTREELLKLNTSDLRSPDSTVSNEERLQQILEGNGIVFESVHRRKDGTEFPVEVSARLMTVEGKKYIQTIIRDITERKRNETALKEAKEQLEKFIEHSIDPIIIGDNTGHVVKPNKAFLDMIGSAEDEIIGMQLDGLSVTETGTYESTTGAMVTITDDFFLESSARIGELFKKGKTFSWETYYKCKSGKIVPVTQNITLIYNAQGEITGSFSIVRDLTEQKKAETALRVSEEHFRAITESSMDAIITSDEQNNIIFCNRAAERMYGYSKEELMGKPAVLLTPESLRERSNTSLQNALKKDMPRLTGRPLEVWGLRKDKQEIPIEAVITTYKIHDKPYFTATIRDITERNQAEKKIRRQAELLELAHDAILISDMDGRIVFWNQGAERTYGWLKQEARGSVTHILLKTRFPKPKEEIAADLLKTGYWEGELTHTTREDERITVESRWVLHSDEKGEPAGIFEINRDITVRKQAEVEMIKANRAYRALGNCNKAVLKAADEMELLSEAVNIVQKDCGYLFVWIGFAENDAGKTVRPVVQAGYEEGYLDTVQITWADTDRGRGPTGTAIRTGKPVIIKNTLADPAFSLWRVEASRRGYASAAAVSLRSGNVSLGALTVYATIPDAFTDEELALLQELANNLAYGIVSLRTSKHRTQLESQLLQTQKMEAIGTLAGGVAHDLNNVLSAMISYPELLLLNLPENSPMRKPIVSIKSAGEKAAAIVNDLLTLARRGVTVSEVANLNTVITDYLSSSQYEKLQSYHPKVEFEINLAPDLLNTMGSPVHFSKTVMNLIANAAEAMPEGGKVTIATENQYLDKPLKGYGKFKDGEYVVLTVNDSGAGISRDDLSKIFEPFFTKKVMGRSGTGLGLAIVWGTVEDHNGYIDVDSELGNGTTFKLYFPATRKEIEVKKESLPIEKYSGHGEHILVVDDIESQREIASTILQKLNYHVETVASGEQAVEYVKSKPVDLVILDMILDPGIDGLETYKRISTVRPQQKAIIASGFSATERVTEAQRLGVGAYIKKPYIMGEIGMAVKNELAR